MLKRLHTWTCAGIKHVLAWVFVGLLTTTAALTYLVSTEGGLRLTYAVARRLAPLDLRVANLHGRLIGPIKLEGVEIRTTKLEIDVQRFEMDWKPTELFEDNLHIRRIDFQGMRIVQRAPSPDEPIKLPEIRFPVAIHIDDAMLEDFRFIRYASATPFVIDHAQLRVYTAGSQIHIDHVTAESPLFDVRGSGAVTSLGPYPLSARAAWTLHLPKLPPISGYAEVKGTVVDHLIFDQQLKTPIVARIQGTVWSPLSAQKLHWHALATTALFPLRTLDPQWPDWRVGGRMLTEGNLHTAAARGDLRAMLEGKTINAHYDIRYDMRQASALTLHRLAFTSPDTPARLDVQGRITDLTQQPRADLSGTWTDLGWPLSGPGRYVSPTGHFKVAGTLNDYRLALETELGGPEMPTSQWSISGHGNMDEFVAQDFQAHLLDGTLQGEGRASWVPGLSWRAHAIGDGLDPGRQWPEWPGRLGLSIDAEGRLGSEGLQTSLDIAQLHGELRHQTLAGTAKLSIAPDGYSVSHLEAQWGDNRLTGSGSVAQEWDMDWRIEAGNMTQIVPEVAGSMRGAIHLGGSRAHPSAALSASAQDLGYGPYRIAQSALAATVDLEDKIHSILDFEAQGVMGGGYTADHLHVTANGTFADHTIDITASVPTANTHLALTGEYANHAWTGALARADINTDMAGYWTLAAPINLTFSLQEASAGHACWQQDQAQLCLQGQWARDRGWNLTADGRGVPLSLFRAYLPSGIQVEGNFDLDASASAPNIGPIIGALTLAATPGAITRVASAQEEELRLEYQNARIEARLDNHALVASVGFNLADRGTLNGGAGAHIIIPRTELPEPFNETETGPAPPFSARMFAEIQDITVLPLIVPALDATHGRVSADLHADGSLAKPRFSGEFALTEVRTRVLPLGIELRDGELHATSAQQNHFQLEGHVNSGKGVLQLKGEGHYDLLHPRLWSAQINLKGENIEVVDISEARALATPNLQIKLAPKRVDITGELTIPQATLRVRDLTGAQHPSEDVVVLDNPEATEPRSSWGVYSQVRLRLGDNVRFQGLGLKARLEGEIVVMDSPQQPTMARGELHAADATYRAYGQNLDVDRGRLLFFGGPVDNPGLDVRAVRHIEEVTAGILIHGSLKSPTLTLFSEPAASEVDTLAYLLLGRPISQATGQEGANLYGAASTLGLVGGEALAGQVGQIFGIEDVHIEGGGGYGAGSLVIRHYLSPKLYVSYGVGLFERLNVLLLRYQISKHWAVEAQSNDAGGGSDLLYTIETHPK